MPSIFSKNTVISGEIDYYCLVCDDKLKTENVVNSHIQKAIHKKNLDQKSFYVKNYENDKIRKVNKGYYCEYCNVLLTSSLKISFHVKLKSHEYNKSDDVDVTSVNRHAKRFENGVIIFDHILVTEKAWNGFIDNNCAYCNIEFDNEELHKTDSNHILNLIQTQLLVGEKRSVYRKIDNNSFHCITCNEVLPLPIESHFDQDSHVDQYVQCRRNKNDMHDNTKKNPPVIETLKKQLPEDKVPQKQELKEPQVEHFSESNSVKKNFEDIKVNKAKVPGRTTETDNHSAPELDPLEELVKKLNLKDYIYVNEKGEPLCMLCEWELSVSNYSVDEHIQGRHHQEILKLHKKRVERGNKNRSSYGNQVQTKPQMKNDVSGTAVKENYSKSENTNTSTEHDIEISNASVESTDKSDILNNVVDLQKQAIAIDFIYEKALCKKCDECLPFQMDEIRNHIKKHSNNTKPKDNSNSGKSSSDLSSISSSSENGTDGTKLFTRPVFKPKNEGESEMSNVAATNTITGTNNSEKSEKDTIVKFASENGINYHFTSNQSYCRICKTQIPNSLSAMKEHVKGARHTRNSPEINVNIIRPVVPQKPYETKTLKDFLESAGKIANRFQEFIVINKKFCVDSFSFHIISRNAGRMRCHMCEKNFNAWDVNRHLVFDSHESHLLSTPVIISEETEFIRIPRNDIFHCGFCNLILAGWSNMQDHMKSLSHRNAKMKSDWALEEFLPGLEMDEMRDAMIKMAILRALFSNL